MKKRKLVLVLMLSLMMLVTMIPSFSFADATGGTGSSAGSGAKSAATSGTCGATGNDHVTWSFDESSGTLTISGSGAMADFNWNSPNTTAPWFSEYKDSITKLVIEEGVTHIGKFSFYNLRKLTGELKIPQSVTSVGDYGYGMNDFTDVDWDKFPLTEVPVGLLDRCEHYNGNGPNNTLVLPDKITKINEAAFRGTNIGGDLVLGKNIEEVGNVAFNNVQITSVEFLNPNCEISKLSFQNCTKLERASLPPTITKINDYMFNGCSSLTTIKISDGVTSIGTWAFKDCSSLTSIELPENLTTIGACAFMGSGITEITVPESVTKFEGMNTFAGCKDLKTIYWNTNLPNSVWGNSHASFDDVGISLDHGTTVVLGENVTKLPKYMFNEWMGACNVKTLVINGTLEEKADPNALSSVALKTIYIQTEECKDKVKNIGITVSNDRVYGVTNGGTFAANTDFAEGSLATPVKTGYAFQGWYDNVACTEKAVTAPQTGNVYYAKWVEKTDQEISFDMGDVTVHANETTVTNTLTKPADGGDVTYTSSDEKIATVNDNGDVTIKGAGTVTITATAAETDNYKKASASYELKVTPHEFSNEWSSDENNHWHKCTVDGCDMKSDFEEHKFQWVVDKEATTTEKGSKHKECTVCGSKEAAVEIPVIENGTTGGDQNNGNAGNSTKADTANGSKTGDTMPIGMLAVLMLAAAAGIVFCGRKLYKSR